MLHLLLDVLLNVSWIQYASALRGRDDLGDKLGMSDGLSSLHDANNGGLRLKVTICGNTLVGLFVFFLGLLCLDLVNLDPVFWIGKTEVDCESIAVVDIFAFWDFRQHSIFGAC